MFLSPSRSPQLDTQVAERFQAGLRAQREQADARIFWVLVAQWAVILTTSFAMASQWENSQLDALSAAIVWVGVLSVLPLSMVLRAPGRLPARWTVVVSQGIFSSLLWYVSGGRPDTSLHLFAWLVIVALYRDLWALLATAAVALVGHAVVATCCVLPALSGSEATEWLTHLVWLTWLVGETVVLGTFVLLDRQSLASKVDREHALESLQDSFQSRVETATRTLVDERDLLKQEVALQRESRTVSDGARVEALRDLMALRRETATHGAAILKLASRPADTSLTREWRSHWQALRQQAQHLTRLIDLPSVGSLDRNATPETPHLKSSKSDQHSKQEAQEKRAMLLMRNPLHQAKAVTALESEGYKVDVVPSGPRSYYSVMLNDYSLIIVDIDLQGDEGYDTLEALRLLPPDRLGESKCVYAVTVEMTPDRILRCTELGVDGILTKPLKVDALRQALHGRTAVRPANDDTRTSRIGSGSAFQQPG